MPSMNNSAHRQAHERVWLRNVHSELPGDTRTCSGENDPYDLWADSTVPGADSTVPAPAPGRTPASAARTVHARSAAGTLALLLLPVTGVLV